MMNRLLATTVLALVMTMPAAAHAAAPTKAEWKIVQRECAGADLF